MKETKDVVACVIDPGGMFMPAARRLAKGVKQVYYYMPWETGFAEIKDCIFGEGIEDLTRIGDFLSPSIFNEIDLFMFPNIMYSGLQEHLDSCGKAVWGSRRADELETLRDKFLHTLEQVGLPVTKYEVVKGLTKLRELLQKVEDKWIKVNRFRGNMETWHHDTYKTSKKELDILAVVFGPFQDKVTFVVQDSIKTDIELGYDGYCIDGQWPKTAIHGYENKNKVYLATAQRVEDMPPSIRLVNNKMTQVFKDYGYKNFFSSEIRLKDGVAYFIDPTCRMPSPAGEEQLEMYENFPDIIWKGANGILVEPIIKHKFCGESLILYKGDPSHWKTFTIPKEADRWAKIYSCGRVNGILNFPPEKGQVVGAVVGVGQTIEEVISSIKRTASVICNGELEVDVSPFAKLLQELKKAEGKGIYFTDQKIPDASITVS